MTEIAAELGLSRETISAVVNDRAARIGVTDETVCRVRAHLELRGYVPSRQARNLRDAPRRVVGLLYVEGLYTHLIDAFHRLAKALSAAAPDVEIVVAEPSRLEAAVRGLLARRVTDLVWIHNGRYPEAYGAPRLAGYLSRMRTVVYNYFFDVSHNDEALLARDIRLVGIDRLAHTHRLARFLHRLGHRTIVLPNDTFRKPSAYKDSFERAGLEVVDFPQPFDAARLLSAVRRQGVTAACFHGDRRACAGMMDLEKRGVRIPEDLTVTGFDGDALAFRNDLTTFVIPVQAMVDKVCDLVAGVDSNVRHCFGLKLYKGVTHGPPPG